jgi:hypothetical protein
MGSANDIMKSFACRDIHTSFPDYEGWVWKPLGEKNHRTPVYEISRPKWDGTRDVVYLAVSLEQAVSPATIEVLKSVGQGERKIVGRVILVPRDTDTSCVPPEYSVLYLTSFGYDAGKLVWLSKKKNARKYPPQPAAA